MKFSTLIVIVSLGANYSVSSWCDVREDTLKEWESLKRDYAQTIQRTPRKAIEKKIITQLAQLDKEKLSILSENPWFWNVILEDVNKEAPNELTKALNVDALDLLVSRLSDVNLRENADIAGILTKIIANIADADLIKKLKPLAKGAILSAKLSDAVSKKLRALRAKIKGETKDKSDINEILAILTTADTERKAQEMDIDTSWLLALSPTAAQEMAQHKDKKQFERVWDTLKHSEPNKINQLNPALLGIIFSELIKEPGYKFLTASDPESHLEIAKTVIRKLDPDGPNFPILFETIVKSAEKNIRPLSDPLNGRAKMIKDENEKKRIIKLLDDAKAKK